jgi:thiol-disulfide isomerase/thioredoxin
MAKKPTPKRPVRAAPKASAGRSNRSGRPAGLLTWMVVGVVVIVFLALILVKVTSSNSPTTTTVFTTAPSSLVDELTQVPASVFNTVGANSPGFDVTAPYYLKGQPALRLNEAKGVTKPVIFYYGAEYCPYCAAERWPFIIAMSRFGTWSNLGLMLSSATDLYANTPTFTFAKATYTSQYLNFVEVEFATNVVDTKYASGYKPLQKTSTAEYKNITYYDNHKRFNQLPASENGSIPYISFDNKYFVLGASYSPSELKGLTRDQIAGALSQSGSLLTQGIVTEANLMTAAICVSTGETPTNVCSTAGVLSADHALNITIKTT